MTPKSYYISSPQTISVRIIIFVYLCILVIDKGIQMERKELNKTFMFSWFLQIYFSVARVNNYKLKCDNG